MPDTITIEPRHVGYILCIVAAVVSVAAVWVIGTIAMKLVVRTRERKSREEEQRNQQRQDELAELFPEPWLKAYKECEAVGNWRVRPIWLKAWLKQRGALPALTIPAITKFAVMVAGSSWDRSFDAALETLTPFFRLPSEPHDADQHEEANKIHHTVCQCHSLGRTKECVSKTT